MYWLISKMQSGQFSLSLKENSTNHLTCLFLTSPNIDLALHRCGSRSEPDGGKMKNAIKGKCSICILNTNIDDVLSI